MKYNFCTLFDSYYLSRGINLYNSLEEHCTDFHLYIFAFDNNSFDVLVKMKLKNATIISLNEFENEDLLAVKSKRTIAEYCWTCTASTISYSIENFSLDHCVYLDADMMFFSSVEPIFKEIDSASVAITAHNFSDDLKVDEIYGKYCVQFVFFRNDKNGQLALNWWKQSCIDWCFAILEEERYGDQKYLNYFKEKFQNVIELQHNGVGVAPWNINRFNIYKEKGRIMLSENLINKVPLIFYHFQGLKFVEDNNRIISEASKVYISNPVLKIIYAPYIEKLSEINKKLIGKEYTKKEIIFKRSYYSIFLRFVKINVKKSIFLRNLFYSVQYKRYDRPRDIG